MFWDEPETNLNPKLIRTLAHSIVHLAAQGIQVFIATHSLFLLRELEIVIIQRRDKDSIPARYFGLVIEDESITLHQSHSVDNIGVITSLEESLAQSDRYMDL